MQEKNAYALIKYHETVSMYICIYVDVYIKPQLYRISNYIQNCAGYTT